MDDLNPCMVLIGEVRRALDSGESVRAAIHRFAGGGSEFSRQCSRWLLLHDKGGDETLVLKEMVSTHRKVLLGLLARGLRGEPIAQALKDLEEEVLEACRAEMDRHLALLPLRLMLPLLILIFPAIMILLFGPLLEAFSAGFSSLASVRG